MRSLTVVGRLANHENSKKHKQMVAKLRRQLLDDDANDNFDISCESVNEKSGTLSENEKYDQESILIETQNNHPNTTFSETSPSSTLSHNYDESFIILDSSEQKRQAEDVLSATEKNFSDLSLGGSEKKKTRRNRRRRKVGHDENISNFSFFFLSREFNPPCHRIHCIV